MRYKIVDRSGVESEEEVFDSVGVTAMTQGTPTPSSTPTKRNVVREAIAIVSVLVLLNLGLFGSLVFGIFRLRRGVAEASHAVFTHETIHTPFGVEDLLRACEEWMVSTPHLDIDFRLSRAGGHHNFAVANDFRVRIPGGVNVRFRHGKQRSG